MLLQNKSNLANIIKTRNSNVVCSSQLAYILPDIFLSVVIVDDNSSCRKGVIKLQKGMDNTLNTDCIIIDTLKYSKHQIMQIYKKNQIQGIVVFYKVSNVNDIAKIRSTTKNRSINIRILGSDDILANNVNPYILKMIIDFDAVYLLNCYGFDDGLSIQHILEYGFASVYSKNYINTESFDIAKNIMDNDELNICLKQNIDMTSFLFDKHSKSNIISMLKSIKNKNCVKVLEVYNSSIIDEALSLVNCVLAECIEDNTNMQKYTANTYRRYLINTKNTFIEPLMIASIDIIKNNLEIYNLHWLSSSGGQ